jgi:hypothetical protein
MDDGRWTIDDGRSRVSSFVYRLSSECRMVLSATAGYHAGPAGASADAGGNWEIGVANHVAAACSMIFIGAKHLRLHDATRRQKRPQMLRPYIVGVAPLLSVLLAAAQPRYARRLTRARKRRRGISAMIMARHDRQCNPTNRNAYRAIQRIAAYGICPPRPP